jgi:hypothetical protein
MASKLERTCSFMYEQEGRGEKKCDARVVSIQKRISYRSVQVQSSMSEKARDLKRRKKEFKNRTRVGVPERTERITK